MRLEFKQAPPHPEYHLDGTKLVLDGQEYKLDELQQDSEKIINLKDGERFLANIILPPREYEEVDTGEVDEEGNAVINRQAKPLNIARVRLVLWQKHVEPENTEDE